MIYFKGFGGPVDMITGYAEILPSGMFVLRNDAGNIFWNTNVTTPSSNGAYLLLQENGNMMIKNGDGSQTFWQTNKTSSC